MNRNRLSINLTPQSVPEIIFKEKLFQVLNEPLNYELHSNGKI
jgi:hypothetical protein